MTGKILKEALVVGVGLTLVGMILHFLTKYVMKHVMKHDMNDNSILALHFFVAGFVVHLLCEYFGVNKCTL